MWERKRARWYFIIWLSLFAERNCQKTLSFSLWDVPSHELYAPNVSALCINSFKFHLTRWRSWTCFGFTHSILAFRRQIAIDESFTNFFHLFPFFSISSHFFQFFSFFLFFYFFSYESIRLTRALWHGKSWNSRWNVYFESIFNACCELFHFLNKNPIYLRVHRTDDFLFSVGPSPFASSNLPKHHKVRSIYQNRYL